MPGTRSELNRNNSINQPIDISDNSSDSNDSDPNDIDPERRVSRHIKKLKFKNPGKFMEDFDPERSSREMRKVNRRIYRETVRKNQVYDNRGFLLVDSRNLCDCLEAKCPGCHFPCPKCSSTKCGADCRCNRRWYYSEINVEGTKIKFTTNLPSAQ